MLEPVDHGEEVVSGELSDHAAEPAAPVRQEILGLAVAARVEQHLPRRGMTRVVLEFQPGVGFAQRDPHRLAAPAYVDHAVRVRELPLEIGARPGRALLLEHRCQHELARGHPDPLQRTTSLVSNGSAASEASSPASTSSASATSSSATDSAGSWL